MKLALTLVLAAVLRGQESSLSARFGELDVRFLTRVEPPGTNARERLPGAVIIDRSRVHHLISDAANKRQFGYDLILEPDSEGATVQLRIQPMDLSNPEGLRPTPGWTLIGLPKYPVLPKVRIGDTIALDLLLNPVTGQKIVDYLTVVRHAEAPAHDFTLADVELTLQRPRVFVNGKLFEASLNAESGTSGVVAWMYMAGHGRFILSLFPNEKLGFQKNGVATGESLTFRDGSAEYRADCAHDVAPGSGRYNLYVLHEPAWKPTHSGDSFVLGSADGPEWVVGKH